MRDAAAFIAARSDAYLSIVERVIAAITAFVRSRAAAHRRAQALAEIAELDDHLLVDIGLVPHDREAIASGQFKPASLDRRLTETRWMVGSSR